MSKKLSTEELTELREINETYQKIVSNLGECEIVLKDIENRKSAVLKDKEGFIFDYMSVKEKSEVLQNKLLEKYGVGKIDIETGNIESM